MGAAGDTIILTAVVRDALGRLLDRPSVTWTSSDAAVATVAADSSGSSGLAFATVTGVSPGSVTITAASGTASATAAVTVTPPQPVASVAVTPESGILLVVGTVRLSATVRDANGKLLVGRPITWTSDNAAVATVDASGVVTGVSVGSATVVATSEGVSDTAAITVTVLSFASVSASPVYTTCGLTPAGAAYCWGTSPGQLGADSSLVPVAVTGGLTFSAVSVGSDHTCGVTTAGAAYCWGANWSGQLGDGSTTYSSVPVAVTGGLTFSAVTVGDDGGYGGRSHTCGLTASGAAYCWGFNFNGQLGIGTATGPEACGSSSWPSCSTVPVPVTGGLRFVALESRGERTCGLTTDGAAYCWGFGWPGLTPSSSVPLAVSGGLRFVAMTVGSHVCGVTAGGAAYCWGYNDWGWLGDGSTNHSSVPVAVIGGLTFSLVSAGVNHTCGLTASGAAYCWGLNNGLLGTGSDTGPELCGAAGDINCSTRPVAVAGGLTFASLSAGWGHTCGVTVGGIAYCWGWGGLGNGTTTGSNVPVKVAGQP